MAPLRSWFLAALVATAQAFPTPENLARLARPDSFEHLHAELLKLRHDRALVKRSNKPIDVSGRHAFTPPGDGDQRGPCPGLNSLANHNYISHDGAAGLLEVISAGNQVFNVGIDFMTLLAVLGVVFVGDPVSLNPSFSIGGQTPKVSNVLDNLGGLLGTPLGLNGSHNLVESDCSPTRNDLYLTGDAWTTNLDFFSQLYDSFKGDTVTLDETYAFLRARFQHSIANNPNFYYGPFTGYVGVPAGYIIMNYIFPNHTDDNPELTTSKDILKAFYGVTELADGSFAYKYGHERIPDNWYRRPTAFGMVEYNTAAVELLLSNPEMMSIGGNTGTVNSFTGLDIGNITGGALNAKTLLEGNNLVCFALETLKTFAPNALSTALKTLSTPLKLIGDAVASPILDLSCPAFREMTMGGTDLWSGLMNTYPGAKRSGSAF